MSPDERWVAETHVSTLLFTPDRVLKVKKPVRTGFLDFTSLEARREACEREIRLNRRLSPDVYLGVADLVLDGATLDHVVVMRRMPEERRLAELLDDPATPEQLDALAALLARFHSGAERGPGVEADCTPEALRELWRAGVDQLAPFAGTPDDPEAVLDAATVQRTWELASAYLDGHGEVVRARLADGRACDGHGDLLAEDIFLLDDGPRVLDCLEFDDHLRHGDVLADVAFLAMDLERLGRPSLARRFLDAYRRHSGDAWPPSLEHLHIAYRAHVRAKVACLRHAQGDPEAPALAQRFLALALGHLERGKVRLVLVGGAPGTGKSTVARALAGELDAVRLSTDDLRAEVVPAEAGPAGELHAGRYAPDRVGDVYDELLRRAAELLAAGRSVVLDASWASAAHRAAAREVAVAGAAHLRELACALPPEEAAARVARRRSDGGDSSEVTPELARRLAVQRDRWPEASELDTREEQGAVLTQALVALGLAGPVGPRADANRPGRS